MPFGIEIQNNNGRIIIDENYANFGFLSTSTSAAAQGSTYPGLAGVVSSDLVVARANTSANGYVSRTAGVGTSKLWATTGIGGASSYIYYVIRRFSTLVSTSTSRYGVEVYTSTGNVAFTSNISKNFDIITVGTINSSRSGVPILYFPSSTGWYSDFTKYYCVMNNTDLWETTFIPPNFIYYRQCYRYVWANSTHGRIEVHSGTATGTSLTPTAAGLGDWKYMIIKEAN